MPAETYDLEPVSGGGWKIVDGYNQVVARYDTHDVGAAIAELNRLNAASEAEPSARR